MNKKKYLEMRAKLMQEAQDCINGGKVIEANDKMKEIETLDKSFEEEAKAKANLEALNKGFEANAIATQIAAGSNVVIGQGAEEKPVDKFDTKEYKNAFMEFVCRNTPIPTEFKNVTASTQTTDAGAVIPTSLMKEIISELKTYGNIWSKVRKVNIQGGVEVPILTLKPTANWVGEGASEDQKIKADGKVSFSYYGLECKIAQSLLASIVTLEMFQEQFTPLAAEAIVAAAEKGVISGDGQGKFLGVTKDARVPAENIIEISEADFTWKNLKQKVFAKMKKSYRNGEFVMSQGTFDSHIDGMADTTGQPIGRVNYGLEGEEKYRFGGKNIETVEDDILPSFDACAVGEVFAVFVKWSDYCVNTNMQMTATKWIDNDTNQVKNKLMLIADGKLLDPHGVIILKKKASV